MCLIRAVFPWTCYALDFWLSWTNYVLPKAWNQFLKVSFYTQFVYHISCTRHLIPYSYCGQHARETYRSSRSCYHKDQAQLLRMIYGIHMAVIRWLIHRFSSPPQSVSLMDAHSWGPWCKKDCAVYLFPTWVYMILLFCQGLPKRKKHQLEISD